MSGMREESIQEMISKCNRCGFCQDVCPTYASSGNEFDVARGRIRMMRMVEEGRYDLNADRVILAQVDQCLLCAACVKNCPSNVATDIILRRFREKILKKKGFSLFHSLLYRGVLTRQERLEKISALIRTLDRTKIRTHVAKVAAKTAFTFLSRATNYLPETLAKPARSAVIKKTSKDRQAQICYFLGCGTNVFTPDTGLASLKVLEKLGLSVEVPLISCCGGPHFASGDVHKARTLARRNIAILAEKNYDAIVSDCATCAHTLGDYASFFLKNDPVQKVIGKLKEKIKDINSFVLEHSHSLNDYPIAASEKMVTYHDPCHAVRGLGVRDAPRQILKAIPGVVLVEMTGADSCCGGAGAYSFRHPDMSQKILNRKIEAIEKTGASVLSTSCPSCLLQLSYGLRVRNLDIKVLHPMELLAQSLE
ncbi:MAG: (Fe-S)-binding protein [Desulfatirhabdiaceae bacterium]